MNRRKRSKAPGAETPDVKVCCDAYEIASVKARKELRQRKQSVDDDSTNYENEVWRLVHALEPARISLQRDPPIRYGDGKDDVFRPDVVALFPDNGLLIDAKSHNQAAFILDWVSKYKSSRDGVRTGLRRDFACKNIIVVVAVDDPAAVPKRALDAVKQLQAHTLSRREVRYYLDLRKSGVGIRDLFLGRLNTKYVDVGDAPNIPALEFRYGGRRKAYIFSANPRSILSRAFVSHRELHSPDQSIIGYQRMLQAAKLKEIRTYIEEGNTFPTPIIVSFPKHADVFQSSGKIAQLVTKDGKTKVQFGHVQLPNKPLSIQIIDGQHRLFGYSRVKEDPSHLIQVIAYQYVDDKEPASMFVDINSKQTSVKSSLMWELYPDIYSMDADKGHLAIISDVCEQVFLSKMKNKVHHISRGTRGPISFWAICNQINVGGLIGSKKGLAWFLAGKSPERAKEKLKLLLESYIEVMTELGTEASNKTINEEWLFTNNGMIPMLRIMSRILRFDEKLRSDETLYSKKTQLKDIYRKYLRPLYAGFATKYDPPALKALRKQRSSGAGVNQTDVEMTQYIRTVSPVFPFQKMVRYGAETPEEMLDISTVLDREEDQKLEFKGSLDLDLKRYFLGDGAKVATEDVKDDFLKNVVGMLNADGGTIVIGVLEKSDFPKLVAHTDELQSTGDKLLCGIEIQYQEKAWDGFQRRLLDIIGKRIGDSVRALIGISRVKVMSKDLCTVRVIRTNWCYLDAKHFFVRCSNQTKELTGRDMDDYKKKFPDR